jgi:hypothetical protein
MERPEAHAFSRGAGGDRARIDHCPAASGK